jgi:hypothetical protein
LISFKIGFALALVLVMSLVFFHRRDLMWSRDRLAELVEKRKNAQEQVRQAEEAVLAYARWQGLTNEEHVDQAVAKKTLDRICDAAEPEEWRKLAPLVGKVDDRLLKGFMHYALRRALEDVRKKARTMDGPEPDPAPRRKRSRGRSR